MEKGFDELTIADDIAKQCTSMYILGLRVCNANSLLHRTTAVHGGIDTSSIFSSGTDAAAYGPVYGEVKSISVGITYHY